MQIEDLVNCSLVNVFERENKTNLIFRRENGETYRLILEVDNNKLFSIIRTVSGKDKSADVTKKEHEYRVKYATTHFNCTCGGELDRIGYHERDSAHDTIRCEKCGWSYSEMESWLI